MSEPSAAPDIAHDSVAAARVGGLRFTHLDRLGITRERVGDGWRYRTPEGTIIRQQGELERLAALVIPPAWEDVWINPDPRGHIQVTGRDTRGRKQYRYHAEWRSTRDHAKFARLAAFGRALPAIRTRVTHDLRRPGLPRPKVEATVVRLLDETLIRIGNEAYARDNASYGLTTLLDQHVDINGEQLHFHFRGKSGKNHEIDVRDRRVATIVHRLQDLPGQHLFQYQGDDGALHTITSEGVNDYLHETGGEPFTAKDFRTWAGTVQAARVLLASERAATQRERQAAIVHAVDAAAARLGNTRAVCRSSYIYPAVLQHYAEGTWPPPCDTSARGSDAPLLDEGEGWLLGFLAAEEATVTDS